MIGERLGSFRIESRIGSGAMGEVFRAVHEPTGKPAAVKIITKEFSSRENAGKRFEREADILRQFKHPNIVRWLGRGKYQGTDYYAMEYVEGNPLDGVLSKREVLPWREVVDLGIQFADALGYAHQKNIIHRDLKPSNLLLTPAGQLKLTDFGIAKDLDATALTRPGRTLGTAAYMAPEQITGTPAVSHKTDLYAFGCVLFQMLTGTTPFKADTHLAMMHAHVREPAPRPSTKNPDVPRALDDLVLQLLAKDPTQRPWDADAVAHTLRELRDQAERGDTIRMAFDRPVRGSATAPDSHGETPASLARTNPLMSTSGVSSTKTRKLKKRSSTVDAPEYGADASWLVRNRRRIETVVLGGLLLGLIGLLAWAFAPASAETLFRKAETLMASERRSDWREAVEKYIEPLDQRFPDNPYKAKTQNWRDRLLLRDTEERALAIQGGTRMGKPKTPIEENYKTLFEAAKVFSQSNQLGMVRARWAEFAAPLEKQAADLSQEDRGWLLLARETLKTVETDLGRKRMLAEETMKSLPLQPSARVKLDLISAAISQCEAASVGDPELAALLDELRRAQVRLSVEAEAGDAPPAEDQPTDAAEPAPPAEPEPAAEPETPPPAR